MFIRDKAHFYKLASKGLCGNTPRTWADVRAFMDDSAGVTHAGVRLTRYGGVVGASPKMPKESVSMWVDRNGLKRGQYVISAVPHRDYGPGLQGELSFSSITGDWNLYFAEMRGYQRAILSEKGQYLRGSSVLWKLKQWIPPHEIDDMMDLFDEYTDSTAGYPTIEFAQTDRIGINPNNEVLIWEIRHH